MVVGELSLMVAARWSRKAFKVFDTQRVDSEALGLPRQHNSFKK